MAALTEAKASNGPTNPLENSSSSDVKIICLGDSAVGKSK